MNENTSTTAKLIDFFVGKISHDEVKKLNLPRQVQNLTGPQGTFEGIWNSVNKITAPLTIAANWTRMIFTLVYMLMTLPMEIFRATMQKFFVANTPTSTPNGVAILTLITEAMQGKTVNPTEVTSRIGSYCPSGILDIVIDKRYAPNYSELMTYLLNVGETKIEDSERYERAIMVTAVTGTLLKLPYSTLQRFYEDVRAAHGVGGTIKKTEPELVTV